MKINKGFLAVLVVLIFFGVLIFQKMRTTGNTVESGKVNFQQISPTQRQAVVQEVLSSELLKELPEKAIISLRFYDFKNGERIWQDEFLVGKNGFVDGGVPDFYLILHSKYISEFNNNLCEIIGKANRNKEFGFYTEQNKAKLLLKYASILKYKKCLSA